ncbi:hypothetical protein COB57_05775 [Candidatus Peregrinibacteria bacterium]|nr:MAG: hypothetical protein COB57_05775 [Candidatus Peregrinibacteria bacterium]
MQYNSDIHHRQSSRLSEYDYSQRGLYFITICTHNQQHIFGKVTISQEISLSKGGIMAKIFWEKIPQHYTHITLKSFIIMPNHIHGILQIQQNTNNDRSSHHFQKTLPNSIGSIVRGYKIAVTKWFRSHTDIHTIWQKNYHDHIIRDENALLNISNYIINNPKKWREDRFFTK